MQTVTACDPIQSIPLGAIRPPVRKPALVEDTIPLMCERCAVHEVAAPGEICQPCHVALSDMRDPRESDEYPQKIKAAKCAGPVVECDEDGKQEDRS